MYFGHGFDPRLVHSQSGLNTGFEPLDFFKGTQNEIIRHMNIRLTKGEICTSVNLIKIFSSDTQVFFFYEVSKTVVSNHRKHCKNVGCIAFEKLISKKCKKVLTSME